MRWNQWYRLKSYFRSALWIVPFIALLLENVAIRLFPVARCCRRKPGAPAIDSIAVRLAAGDPRSDGHGSWRVLPPAVGAGWKSRRRSPPPRVRSPLWWWSKKGQAVPTPLPAT